MNTVSIDSDPLPPAIVENNNSGQSYGSAKSWKGDGFLLLHIHFKRDMVAMSTPQDTFVERTRYGMRLGFKTGRQGWCAGKLFAFVFRSKGDGGVAIVCPSLLFLCIMFVLPSVAVSVCASFWVLKGTVMFVSFGVPVLSMAILWQMHIQKFIFENLYCGQKRYDQYCRQFIATLRDPCDLSIITMRRIGWGGAWVNLSWQYLVAIVRR